MLYNFKTVADDQQWVIDTEALTWARASSILAAPTIKAAASNLAHFEAVESGPLAPFGNGVFRFVGRKEPQLAIIAVFWVPVTDEDSQITMVNILQANVDIKDGKAQDIKRYKTECLPAAKPKNPAAQPIVQPAITVDEQKAAAPEEPTLTAALPDLSAAQPAPESTASAEPENPVV